MSISIIIPTLNEAERISGAIAALRPLGSCEVIVVDGGSADETLRQARGADAVLRSPPGRAVQMNAGARQATGTHLLFLHADCTLAGGALAAIERRLHNPNVIAGCFTTCVAAPGPLYRCIGAAAGMRVRLSGVVYGDQGLFLRRRDFERLGGFPPVRFMEDVLFSQRLRHEGKVIVVPERIVVAARRWQKVGIVRQTLRNWALTALALGGVHPDRLARFYPHVR
jgi:rSAM/selenodomain-associated transferase 2